MMLFLASSRVLNASLQRQSKTASGKGSVVIFCVLPSQRLSKFASCRLDLSSSPILCQLQKTSIDSKLPCECQPLRDSLAEPIKLTRLLASSMKTPIFSWYIPCDCRRKAILISNAPTASSVASTRVGWFVAESARSWFISFINRF